MYELFIALKYLIPKKRAISTAVISLIAFVVISLVVWLTLVFLSVTAGLEQNWLRKLTSVNAPIRITPTAEYYKSYYYLIDSLSAASSYETKTIGEKKSSKLSDVYSHETDMEIPYYWKEPDLGNDGKLKDFVQLAYRNLADLKANYPTLKYQDYEISGAFMRLTLNHGALSVIPKTSFLSQMTYILSLSELNPNLSDLLIKPTVDDISHLLTRRNHTVLKDREAIFQVKHNINESVLANIQIKQVKLYDGCQIPFYLLPDNIAFNAKTLSQRSKRFLLINNKKSNKQIIKLKNKIQYIVDGKVMDSFDAMEVSFTLDQPIIFDVYRTESENKTLFIKGTIQNKALQGKIAFDQCQIIDATANSYFEKTPIITPPWIYHVKDQGWILPSSNNNYGVLLPKSFKKNTVLVGDVGYFGYSSTSSASSKEMRTPFYVAGFYDPGVFPLGNRFLIAPIDLIRVINSSSFVSANEISNNGIFVWHPSLKEAKKIKEQLQDKFTAEKINPYWKVESYEDFEFSKDLFQQFQSDKLLFTLIAIIILMVACSNIVSMLVLLVNDKKKEIAILMSLGATKKSIALIFGACGFITGFLSSATGTIIAIFTLKHIDKIVSLLSSIQGHQAFNVAFFGNALPNSLSSEALLFILIATPIISLLAGLIPAYKAAKLNPSRVLRS